MAASAIEICAAVCFALAIVHTFSVGWFQGLGARAQKGSVAENVYQLLGEVEVVFGFWAAVFLLYFGFQSTAAEAIQYLESRDFTEPIFVFVVMCICATRPVLVVAEKAIEFIAVLLPLPKSLALYVTTLVAGPLFGSLITEPAAMTVTALILLNRFYGHGLSRNFRYATLGLLFVNVSIGGTWTPYAAPPVLMVAEKWDWDLGFMLTHFGWKAAVAILVSTALTAFRFRKELSAVPFQRSAPAELPLWVPLAYFMFLAIAVAGAHHKALFIGAFLFFLGLVKVTREYQIEVRLREGLLVAFFLSGLVVLGGYQAWWLESLLKSFGAGTLYLGSAVLTSVTDNAALTYLGSQVPDLSEVSRYALVAGSVVGGGLTVIANAPNPAGFGILNASFGSSGISSARLFISALIPTLIAGFCFWFL